jgi:hypothetical protein
VKKHKEDIHALDRVNNGMDPRVLAAHNFYKDMILDKIAAKTAASAMAPE